MLTFLAGPGDVEVWNCRREMRQGPLRNWNCQICGRLKVKKNCLTRSL